MAGAAAADNLDRSYLHAPFLDPDDYLRALAWLRWTPPPRPRRPTVAAPARRRSQLRSSNSAVDPWHQAGFTLTEQDVWLAHGLTPHDARLAATCRDAGLTPASLHQRIDGRTVHDLLRDGQHVAAVAARLRSPHQGPSVAEADAS